MTAAKIWMWRIALTLAVLIVLALGAASALLLTQPGRNLTADLVAQTASTKDQQIEISGLSQILGNSLRIDEVRLLDADGVWVEIQDVQLDYQLGQLFSRSVVLDNLSVTQLHVRRLPKSTTSPAPEQVEFAMPNQLLPSPLRALDVEQVEIANIILDEPVLGTARRLAINGALAARNTPMTTSGDLQLFSQNRDGPIMHAQWSIAPEADGFGLSVKVDESGEGFFC